MATTYCGLDTNNPTTPFFCKEMRAGETQVACGRCRIARCCRNRGHETCAECDEFPCDDLLSFSYSPADGDGGVRIEALRQRAAAR